MPAEADHRGGAFFEAGARAVLAAAIFGLANVIHLALARRQAGIAFTLDIEITFVEGAALTVAAFPSSLLEAFAERRRSSWLRAGIAAALAFSIAFVAVRFNRSVVTYVFRVLEERSPVAAVAFIWKQGFAPLVPETAFQLLAAIAWSLSFALLLLVRVRSVPIVKQVVVLVAAPSAVVLAAWSRTHAFASMGWARYWITAIVVFAFSMPLVAAFARRVGDRLFKRITLSPDEPAPTPIAGMAHRRRLLAWAAIVWASSVLVLASWRADRVRRFEPLPPEETAICQSWEAALAGKLSPREIAELASTSTSVIHRARGRVGEEDALCVESHVEVRGADGIGSRSARVVEDSTAWLDGERREERWEYGGPSCMGWQRRWWGTQTTRHLSVRGVRAGEHEVAVLTSLSIVDRRSNATMWSRTFRSRHTVLAVRGSIRDEVKLDEPPRFDADWFLYRSELEARNPEYVMFATEPAPLAVMAQVRVIEESGTVVQTQRLRCERGEKSQITFRPNAWNLAPGRHRMFMTITPDRDYALEQSPTVDAILGTTFHREIVIDKR